MNVVRRRALNQFPMVLLTLVSIIQALALELMWGKISGGGAYLWQWNMDALVAWGTISVTLLGILQVWILYATLVIGFTWLPTLRDSVLPFVLGILEFTMISLVGPEFNALWLYALASLFLFGNYVAHVSFRRARIEPDNAAFFAGRPPATWKDFIWAFSNIGLLILFGMAYTALGGPAWLALFSIVFANFVLIVQIVGSRRLWLTIVGADS